MKIKHLGTAAAEGWPGVFCACDPCRKAREKGGKDIRTRSSALINDTLMVDLPPDTYCHVVNFQLDLSKLNHLVITHSHQDHFYSDELKFRRPVYAYFDDDSMLQIYGNKAVRDIVTSILDSDTALKKYIDFKYVPPFETVSAGEIRITPLLALHNRNEDCYIYIFEGEDGKRILYANDTGVFPEKTWEYISGRRFDLVSLDCTSGPYPEGNYHMGIPDNIKVKEKLIELGCADNSTRFILTHFSHNGKALYDELVELSSPYNFEIAYDGLEIVL